MPTIEYLPKKVTRQSSIVQHYSMQANTISSKIEQVCKMQIYTQDRCIIKPLSSTAAVHSSLSCGDKRERTHANNKCTSFQLFSLISFCDANSCFVFPRRRRQKQKPFSNHHQPRILPLYNDGSLVSLLSGLPGAF
jgi:hypothetical protein